MPDAGPPPGAALGPAVTYHQDVAPLLARHCLSCHAQGGMAPFTLESYADARALEEGAAVHGRQRAGQAASQTAGKRCGALAV